MTEVEREIVLLEALLAGLMDIEAPDGRRYWKKTETAIKDRIAELILLTEEKK